MKPKYGAEAPKHILAYVLMILKPDLQIALGQMLEGTTLPNPVLTEEEWKALPELIHIGIVFIRGFPIHVLISNTNARRAIFGFDCDLYQFKMMDLAAMNGKLAVRIKQYISNFKF
jgi:hypothetical protein